MYAVTCVLLLVPLLFAARASALKYLQRAGKTIEARRDEVRRLWRRKHGHGGSGALIGGIGGAVALAAVGDTHMESVQTDKASRGGHGGVAVVGYGIGHGKLRLAYRAPTPPKR